MAVKGPLDGDYSAVQNGLNDMHVGRDSGSLSPMAQAGMGPQTIGTVRKLLPNL